MARMNVGLHPHVIGQPHRVAALREFIEYVKGKPQVWFPTREEIATWFLAENGRRVARLHKNAIRGAIHLCWHWLNPQSR